MKARIIPVSVFLLFIYLLPFKVFSQNYYLDQANAAIKQQDFDKALEYLNQEISEHEKNGMAYYYRALLYWNKWEENAKALRDVNLALDYLSKKEKPQKARAYQLRGEIYLEIGRAHV